MVETFSFVNSKGVTYYLNGQAVTLKNGRQVTIYFFSKDVREKTALNALPEGFQVVETTRTAMPVLKKSV